MLRAAKNFAKQSLKSLASVIDPPAVSWRGNFPSWEEASAVSSGYSQSNILARCAEASKRVITGSAAFARDGVAFQSAEYNLPLVSAILYVFADLRRPIRVCDFGGALGDTYHQNAHLISDKIASWVVIEQPNYVTLGKTQFQYDAVTFSDNLTESLALEPDLLLFSSVLQYLQDPMEIIRQAVSAHTKYIAIDRTPLTMGPNERITVQYVKPPLYDATYPCRFFSRESLLQKFVGYTSVFEWEALDRANIPSKFQGFLLTHAIPPTVHVAQEDNKL